MDERIIDRKLFIDLANEVGLNASHIEAMGEMRHCEITVSGNMLERLVEIQHQFEQLTVMGDDEYRGFYIVVPRPTPEEWGDVEELIASGEYQSKEAFLADWLAFNPTETQWFHVTSYKYEEFRSIRITDRKHAHFVITNRSSCADGESDDGWYQDSLARLFCYLQRLVDVIVANPDGFNDYVAHKFMREDEQPSVFRGTDTWSLLLHWSAKETMFKCLNASEVDFRGHMRILPFAVNESGVFSAEEYRTVEKRRFTIHYYLFPDFVLTLSL